jgi:hypothetical protein
MSMPGLLKHVQNFVYEKDYWFDNHQHWPDFLRKRTGADMLPMLS